VDTGLRTHQRECRGSPQMGHGGNEVRYALQLDQVSHIEEAELISSRAATSNLQRRLGGTIGDDVNGCLDPRALVQRCLDESAWDYDVISCGDFRILAVAFLHAVRQQVKGLRPIWIPLASLGENP